MKAIEIENLSKSYDQIRALAKVSFTIEPGEVIGLLGPNGAGKTTLMKILTGYLEPDAGDVRVHGIDVVEDPISAQRRIGYLPESAPLYHDMLVQEYLEMLAAMRGVNYGDRKARMVEAIRSTGLEDRCTQPIGTLSKGYRQRVGIAQAIIHQPDILILDEPTTGLDPTQIVEIRDMIKRLAANTRTTVLLSTHILSEVEAACERVLVIMQGELRADANLADLRSSNAAVVAIEAGAEGVEKLLSQVDGVAGVEHLDGTGEFQRWRVTGKTATDLCPALFEALRATTWKLGELRPDPKTLERVFRDLAAGKPAEVPGAKKKAGKPAGVVKPKKTEGEAKAKDGAAAKAGAKDGSAKAGAKDGAAAKDGAKDATAKDGTDDERAKYGKKADEAIAKAEATKARSEDTADTKAGDKTDADDKKVSAKAGATKAKSEDTKADTKADDKADAGDRKVSAKAEATKAKSEDTKADTEAGDKAGGDAKAVATKASSEDAKVDAEGAEAAKAEDAKAGGDGKKVGAKAEAAKADAPDGKADKADDKAKKQEAAS